MSRHYFVRLLCAVAIVTFGAAVAAAGGGEIRLMSYNILHGKGADRKVDNPVVAVVDLDAAVKPVEVRVRQTPGGPRIFVDGKAVRPRGGRVCARAGARGGPA